MQPSNHLQGAVSGRGLTYMPTIGGRGCTIGAQESSLADGPCLMLVVNVTGTQVNAILPAEEAWKLADQLHALVRNHYQGDATPEWAVDNG